MSKRAIDKDALAFKVIRRIPEGAGWLLIEADTRGWEIQRDDEADPQVFATDDAAEAHVWDRALWKKDSAEAAAMAFLREFRPEEYARIEKFANSYPEIASRVSDACFECGEWTKDDDLPYREAFARAQSARAALDHYVRARAAEYASLEERWMEAREILSGVFAATMTNEDPTCLSEELHARVNDYLHRGGG